MYVPNLMVQLIEGSSQVAIHPLVTALRSGCGFTAVGQAMFDFHPEVLEEPFEEITSKALMVVVDDLSGETEYRYPFVHDYFDVLLASLGCYRNCDHKV